MGIIAYVSVRLLSGRQIVNALCNLLEQSRVAVVAVHIHSPEHPFAYELRAPGPGVVLVAEGFHQLVHILLHYHSAVAQVYTGPDVTADLDSAYSLRCFVSALSGRLSGNIGGIQT